ncbi:MAG: thioredoxin domain-containing protein, partial [Thermomicrobiales bacterium]|nr:thioredoxin domain-containing protein [Thermomicrobiales bacterium]
MVAELSATQRQEVEGIVKDYLTTNPGFIRDYLMANPEVIRDAIDELQRKQDEAERASQVAAIDDNRELLFSSPRQVVMGNPDGNVTLIEFFDYNCGYCRRAQADMQQLMADDPDLKVVLKEFPVLGEGSMEASQVSVAVRI